MKAFAKMLSILLAFLTVLSLCSCAKKEEVSSEWVGVEETRQGAISDTGYYYLNNQNLLYYVDFQNGINVCLCNKAGCPHGTTTVPEELSECEALLPTAFGWISTMFCWNQYIYYMKLDQYGRSLYRRNADGTGEAKVAILCEKYMEEDSEIEVDVYCFTVAGNYVYYYAAIKAVIQTEEGVFTNQNKLTALLRLDLRTGKEEILTECYESNKGLRLVAVRNDSAIYSLASFPDADYSAENYNTLYAQCPVQILQWNAESGESNVLLEKTRAEIGDAICYMGGSFYCYPGNDQYSIDLETGELTQVVANGSLRIINADIGIGHSDETGRFQVKNLKTGKLLPNAYEAYLLQIVCASNDMLIITYLVENDDRTKDEHFMFIKPESLSDGLQEEDATEFYIRHYSAYTSS